MLGWKLYENGVPNHHTHFQVLWKIFLKHLSSYMSCYVLSATNWQISNPETEHKKPSPNTSSLSTLWYPWPSQTALVQQGRVQCARRLTRKNLFPEHCGSAISVTQLQHLPRSLHHVTCCEAFHGNTARKLPFGGPSPNALLQNAAAPSPRQLLPPPQEQ